VSSYQTEGDALKHNKDKEYQALPALAQKSLVQQALASFMTT
jgi:hypothetical protein